MSDESCTCFSGKSPLGLPTCVPTFGKDTVLIVMDEVAADGTYNEIKTTDLVDGKLPKTFVDAKLNHDDESKKWFMTAAFDIVDPVRAEPIIEELGGIPNVVRQGNLIWTGTMSAAPAYLKALQTHTCGTNKVFFTVDAQGNLKGKKVLNENGEWVFRGRKIQKGTMYNMYNEGTKDEKEKIMLVFMVAETENDANFSFLSVSSMSFNFHSLPGIYTTLLEWVGDITATGGTFKAYNYFGSFGKDLPTKGLIDDDMDLYNNTDDAAVVIATMEEQVSAPGYYDVTWASQTLGDELKLSLDKDYYYAESITATIPT